MVAPILPVGEFGRDDAGLHERRVEEIARDNAESRVFPQRLCNRPNDVVIAGAPPFHVE